MAIIYFAVIAVLVGADQLIKFLVDKNIELYTSVSAVKIGDFELFNLTHVLNDGASWSILSGKTLFLIIFTSVFLIAGIIFFLKNLNRNPVLTSSLILIISGGLGNLIDRIFRNGRVIDYIEARFIDFPIFNLADIFVVIGAILLAVFIFFLDRPEKSSGGSDANETDASDEKA